MTLIERESNVLQSFSPELKITSNEVKASPKRNLGDAIFKYITLAFAALVLLLILLMGFEMYQDSKPAILKFGWGFLTGTEWDPVREQYGALPFIFGTMFSSAIALVIALPLSLGIAIFLSELAPPRLERPLSFLIELLAGIPSIVFGIWGIFVLVPWIRTNVEPLLSRHLGFLPLFHGAPYGFVGKNPKRKMQSRTPGIASSVFD